MEVVDADGTQDEMTQKFNETIGQLNDWSQLVIMVKEKTELLIINEGEQRFIPVFFTQFEKFTFNAEKPDSLASSQDASLTGTASTEFSLHFFDQFKYDWEPVIEQFGAKLKMAIPTE